MKNPKGGPSQNRRKSSKDSTFQPFPVTSPKYSGAWMDEVHAMITVLKQAQAAPAKVTLHTGEVRPQGG